MEELARKLAKPRTKGVYIAPLKRWNESGPRIAIAFWLTASAVAAMLILV